MIASILKRLGRFFFLLLLTAHFGLIFLFFAPTDSLLSWIDKTLKWIEPTDIPELVQTLEKQHDFVVAATLPYDNNFERLCVFILEWRREHLMDPEEQLAYDLSILNFGESIFGMEAASEYYYQKPLSEIGEEEWVLLINLHKIFLK